MITKMMVIPGQIPVLLIGQSTQYVRKCLVGNGVNAVYFINLVVFEGVLWWSAG